MKNLSLLTTTLIGSILLLSACGGDVGVTTNGSATSQQMDEHTDESIESSHGDEHDDDEEQDVVKLSNDAAREAGIIVSRAELGALEKSVSLPAEILSLIHI